MIKYKADQETDAQERRQHRRCAVFWPGKLSCQGCSINFDLLDISAGGARIHLSAPLIDSSTVTVRIDRIGEFRAEVVWRGLDDAGLRFLDEGDFLPPCMQKGAAGPTCDAIDVPPCFAAEPRLNRCASTRAPANDPG